MDYSAQGLASLTPRASRILYETVPRTCLPQFLQSVRLLDALQPKGLIYTTLAAKVGDSILEFL